MSSSVRLSSVCLSVCLSSVCLSSVTFVHPAQPIEIFRNIFIWYERSFILVFWEEASLVGDDPFYVKFWVIRPPLERNRRFSTDIRRSSSAVTPSEKSSINTNRKPTTRFPVSLRWSSYVAPKSPKGGCKTQKCWKPGLRPSTTLHRIITTVFTFGSMELKFVTSKNAVNADRIMKFIDENELNYIWTIRCDNSETVQDRMSVLFGFR